MTAPPPIPTPARKAFAWKTDPTVKPEERLVSGFVTTEDVDMDREVLVAAGAKHQRYFNRIRSVNFNHKKDAPVGVCRDFSIRPGKGVWAKTYVTKTALGNDVLTMVNEGVITGFSVEFGYISYGPPTPQEKALYGPECENVHREWEWMAYCFTHMPCNPYALIDGVKSLRKDLDLGQVEKSRSKIADLYRGGKLSMFGLVACDLTPDDVVRKSWSMMDLGDGLTAVVRKAAA